jgi:hypothetical protein
MLYAAVMWFDAGVKYWKITHIKNKKFPNFVKWVHADQQYL